MARSRWRCRGSGATSRTTGSVKTDGFCSGWDGSVDVWFDDRAAFDAALASPEWAALLEDDARLFDRRSDTPAVRGRRGRGVRDALGRASRTSGPTRPPGRSGGCSAAAAIRPRAAAPRARRLTRGGRHGDDSRTHPRRRSGCGPLRRLPPARPCSVTRRGGRGSRPPSGTTPTCRASSMKELMQRTRRPGDPRHRRSGSRCLGRLRLGGVWFWGSWWCVPFFIVYGVLYGSASDSRWHEMRPWHGVQDALDERRRLPDRLLHDPARADVWRWSHARHHTDTIIVGRDPEIAVTRPPDIAAARCSTSSRCKSDLQCAVSVWRCTRAGRLTAEEKTFMPEWSVGRSIRRRASGSAIFARRDRRCASTCSSILPVMLVGLPTLLRRLADI